jgi:Septum formation initiator.
MHQLENEKTRLSVHLASLNETNTDLNSRLQNLTADPDTISIYAHELGYVSEGEQLIKLAGFSGGIDRDLMAGEPIIVKKPDFLPEWICKLLGLVTGGMTFFAILFSFPGAYHDNRKKGF